MQNNQRVITIKIALVYFLIAVVWIFTSDHILLNQIPDPTTLTHFQSIKDTVFIILSFLILNENTPEGLEGDLIVSIDNSNPSTDVWLQDGDLYIYDPLAPDYYFNLDGDVILECTE